MTKTELTIVANFRPEVLERILRVVRHRGYQVTEMKMLLENKKVWVDLTVESQRDVCLLVPQLKKLFDVIDVTCESCD
ncbi:acetolactate synthase 2 small subunit [uncultured Actinobacillus sp.]|uniref:acetolactate synthase 2 small subunit n=1 Tax=uncultured Actinobacillus sp. TaxID=417616 RepID=UPI0025E39332|nr:acetolactate synthase 2 small subunit [uncultured Actinobacillus sp.]